MRFGKGWFPLLLAVVVVVGGWAVRQPAVADTPKQVPYPSDYRQWSHVKSMLISSGHPLFDAFGGLHHVYANAKALAGLRTKRYTDGAVFAFDLLDVKADGNATVETTRKVLGVMHFDSKRYAATGGWGFEGFKGNTRERVVTDGGESCFACHRAQEASQYVFSTWRE